MSKVAKAQEKWQEVFWNNYGTPKVALARGAGAHVWDLDGKEYLDFVAGIAVNILGHANPALINAVTTQMSTLGHTSNLVMHEPGLALAQKLVDLVGGNAKVFLCNSGAEANEAAIKLSRLTGKTQIVALKMSFHGRTSGTTAMTGQPKKFEPFLPLLPDVVFVEANNVEELKATITDKTAAVWIEPVQGEGGVLPMSQEFMNSARELCTKHDAMLVLDEVQTGIARTGNMFAHEHYGIKPDVLLLAKGLGGGFPIGACISFGKYKDLMGQGLHGSTFGGNAPACAAGLAVLKEVEEQNLIKRALEIGQAFTALVDAPHVKQVRGLGAMIGVVLDAEVGGDVELKCRENGLLINSINPTVLRIVPPLIVTDEEVQQAISIIRDALGDVG